MLNPLVDSLEGFTVNQLEDKIVDLQRKYFMSSNPQVQAQISTILYIYKEEVQTRRAIEYQRQRDQEGGEKGLDSLINIS
jgi:hypothetical protein